MTSNGRCLCGAVSFSIATIVGPLEICHCQRCRQVTGGAGMPGLTVSRHGFTLTGREMIKKVILPLVTAPPAYHNFFCQRCGSPVPDPDPASATLEVPAGLLEDVSDLKADRHIYIEYRPGWDDYPDQIPGYDRQALAALRGQAKTDKDSG